MRNTIHKAKCFYDLPVVVFFMEDTVAFGLPVLNVIAGRQCLLRTNCVTPGA